MQKYKAFIPTSFTLLKLYSSVNTETQSRYCNPNLGDMNILEIKLQRNIQNLNNIDTHIN